MNSLEFINQQIRVNEINKSIAEKRLNFILTHYDCSECDYYFEKEGLKGQISIYENCIKGFEQIKTELEAWEVVKKHCDYQDGDKFNCIPEGFYLIEPIRGKNFLIVKKALEVK